MVRNPLDTGITWNCYLVVYIYHVIHACSVSVVIPAGMTLQKQSGSNDSVVILPQEWSGWQNKFSHVGKTNALTLAQV
jgi:hypothetical protein